MDHVFARAHSSYVGSLMLLTMCDVTMLQFLPWKRSTFYTESEGYPDLSVMKFAVGIKTVQALVSVLCQMAYLALETQVVDDPTTSAQAQALFSLNIVFSVLGAGHGVFVFVSKNSALRSAQKQHETSVQKKCSGASGDDVQMHDLYSDRESDAGTMMMEDRLSEGGGGMANPMHTEEVLGMRRRIKELAREIEEVRGGNEALAGRTPRVVL
jgi:hypothetical protein